MQIDVPYGKQEVSVEVEDARVVGIFPPNQVEIRDAQALLQSALTKPFGGPDFQAFVESAADIMVIVNDATRPTPTAAVMTLLQPYLNGRNVRIMAATGAHRAPTEAEWKSILGENYEAYKERLLVHDAKQSEMVFLGTSKNGTPMHLNRHVVEADSLLVVGSVEPHYFAGFTGGRKAFLPGVAAYQTIEQNHKYALRDEARSLALVGNPVHEDMADAMDVLAEKKIFSIQTVLDREHHIYGVTAGDIHASFDAAIGMAHDVFCVDIPELADVVVAVAPYPMDIDLYQSQKALENGRLALKPGGILILVSQCRDGIGGKTFYDLLSSCEKPEAVLDKIAGEYKLGYHKAAKIASLSAYGSIWGVSDLDDKDLQAIFITPKASIQGAIDDALAAKGPNARVLFLPGASITVPNLSPQSSSS